MRTYVNEPFVRRRAKLAKIFSWAGLGILAIGMFLSLRADPGVLRVANNNDALVRGVARDRSAIAFWDYNLVSAIADQVRLVPVDGILPTAETVADRSYPLAGDDVTVAVVVSPLSTWFPEAGLTKAQLAQVFSNLQYRWSEVEAGWPATPIKRFGPDSRTATYAAFLDRVMRPVFSDEAEFRLTGPANANYRWMILGSFACLILGFIAANLGGYNMRRFGRSPRPDERLAQQLKGFDDRYQLYAWVLPAPYVFVGPSGIYTIALREQAGKATNIGDKWTQPFSLARLFLAFSNEGIGNPTADAKQDAQRVQQLLAEHMPDLQVTVQPIVMFTNPRAELELKNPEVPVVTPQGFKALLRQRKREAQLTNQRLEELRRLFVGEQQPVSREAPEAS
ncbi:MAG: hypothetical protein NZ528_12010 [Caldilineales bacterium]|nr:hypothetical protein [Caldilineales bacterium]MDW8318539.1 hypothetical protein [Anaerolineae bacterium]